MPPTSIWECDFPFFPGRCFLLTFCVCGRCFVLQRHPVHFHPQECPGAGIWINTALKPGLSCSQNFQAMGLGVKAVIEGNPGRKCEEELWFYLRKPVLAWTWINPCVPFGFILAGLSLFVVLEFLSPQGSEFLWINPESIKHEDFFLVVDAKLQLLHFSLMEKVVRWWQNPQKAHPGVGKSHIQDLVSVFP